MNCVGSSEYMAVFASFARASFLHIRADQSSNLWGGTGGREPGRIGGGRGTGGGRGKGGKREF